MKTYLEREEIERLGDEARCLRDKLLVRLLSRLGCRVSEALGVTVDDIDFRQGTVTIEHLKSRIRLVCTSCGARIGKSHAYCPKCGQTIYETITEARQHRRMRTLPT